MGGIEYIMDKRNRIERNWTKRSFKKNRDGRAVDDQIILRGSKFSLIRSLNRNGIQNAFTVDSFSVNSVVIIICNKDFHASTNY